VAVPETVARAEALTDRLLPERTPKKRMLVIVNPYVPSGTAVGAVVWLSQQRA
jgi:hypothetical protein